MTGRGQALLLLAAGAFYTGLSLGGRMFYLAAVFALLALIFSLSTVLAARRLLRVSCTLLPPKGVRGDQTCLRTSVSSRIPLPLAALRLTVILCGQETERIVYLSRGKCETEVRETMRHIGLLRGGVSRAEIRDILGLFCARVRFEDSMAEQLVLPHSFEVEPLHFSQEEEGRTLLRRATEDLSSPEDTRAYRSGDALKRIHWKLSARKRELVVRRFETPSPSDTLILLDCTCPAAWTTPADAEECLRDTLCETALSVAEMQTRGNYPIRVPLYGSEAAEYVSQRGSGTDTLAEMLARQTFDGGEGFARVLNLELRRMRRAGATVIITSRLTADVAEGIKHIRRMGPSARLYYVTYKPEDPSDRPYISQLLRQGVEVCYVTPA